MKVQTLLYDLVDVLGAVPGISRIKLEQTHSGVKISGIRDDPHKNWHLVLHGRTLQPVDDTPAVLGITDIDDLRAVLDAPGMSRLDAEVAFDTDKYSMWITNGAKQRHAVAIFSHRVIDEVFKIPPLKSGVKFQVHTRPSLEGIRMHKHWTAHWGALHETETLVSPFTKAGGLSFRMKLSPRQSHEYMFAENVNGSLPIEFRYPSKLLLDLFSLVRTTKDTVVSFSDQGLCRVRVSTSCAEYDFFVCGCK